MKIALIGNYGATNVGDDAILESILETHKEHDFIVLSASHKDVHAQLNVETAPLFPLGFRSLLKNGFRKSKKALKSVDAVVLGGGGLFQDNYLYACFLWAWQLRHVKKAKKPLFIYGAGVGPLRTKIGRKLARNAFNYASKITVRDSESLQTLLDLGIDHNKIEVGTDPVFSMEVPHEVERKKGTYLISLRPWLKNDVNTIEVFTNFLLKLKEEKGAKFKFVVMQQIKEHDHKILDQIAEVIGGEILIPENFNQLLSAMNETEFAIGMRYHFLIAALMTNTPALPISYSPKVDGLFVDSPLEKYVLPVENISLEQLQDMLVTISVDYNNMKNSEKRRLEQLKELAHINETQLEIFLKNI